MKPFSEQIKVEGLFEYTARLQREKRYSMQQQGGTWYPPVRQLAKRSPVAQPPEVISYGKVKPLMPLVVTSIDNVEDEVETFSEDDIVELVPSAPLPYEECLGDGVPSDGEVEQEEGGGQLDVVTADEE